MSTAFAPQRWFSQWRAMAAQPRPDPADLGTAFGLDQSFSADPATVGPRWAETLAAAYGFGRLARGLHAAD